MIKNKVFPVFVIFSILLAACAGPMSTNVSNAPQSASPASDAVAAFQPSVAPTDVSEAQVVLAPAVASTTSLTYPIVDTGQGKCYDNNAEVTCPQAGNTFFGQDAQFSGNAPSYALSADGLTVSDNVTGLTWQRSPDTNGDGSLNKSDKLTLAQSQTFARQTELRQLWRL